MTKNEYKVECAIWVEASTPEEARKLVEDRNESVEIDSIEDWDESK